MEGSWWYPFNAFGISNICSSDKILEREYKPFKTKYGAIITPKRYSFYNNKKYDAFLGRATIYFNSAGVAVGLYDTYDFNKQDWGTRPFMAEFKTRGVFYTSPKGAKPYNINFGINK